MADGFSFILHLFSSVRWEVVWQRASLDEPTAVQPTRAEALVLCEWLYRLRGRWRGRHIGQVRTGSPIKPLVSLESALVEPFRENYNGLVNQAGTIWPLRRSPVHNQAEEGVPESGGIPVGRR